MKRRGRPPHPDILTPREWEVLALLREGLANPEIAERLGVTRDAVKYHVSQILSKLGVDNREDASLWRPAERPWWAAGYAALGALARRLPLLVKAGLVGASLLALAGLGILAWGVLTTASSDESRNQAGAPEEDSLPLSSFSPTETSGGGDTELPVVGTEIELPVHVALILETGCFQCDGGPTGLIRVYRDPSGNYRRDLLFSAGEHVFSGEDETQAVYAAGDLPLPTRVVQTSKGPQEEKAYITGFAINAAGAEIVISVCIDGACGSQGMDAWIPPAETALYRSVDGGITWTDFGRLGAGGAAIGLVGPGRVLVSLRKSSDGPPDFLIYPDGESVHRPDFASGVGSRPIVLADGTIAWPDRSGVLARRDGSLIAQASSGQGPWGLVWAAQNPSSGDTFVYWSANDPEQRGFIDQSSSQGSLVRTLPHSRFLIHGAWLSENEILVTAGFDPHELASAGNGFLGILPAILDFNTSRINPIVRPFLDQGAEVGRNFVHGVQRGPFARVVNTGGDCLNIRSEPGSTEIIDCVAEAVLLTDLGPLSFLEGTTWINVRTPAGVEGWASVEFLEATGRP